MIRKLQSTFHEYPRQFWLLITSSFIDSVGGFLIFPFFSLYFTEKFDVSLSQVGIIYAIWALTGIFGQVLGGVLTDQIGRKFIVIVGLIFSALTSLALALVTNMDMVYLASAIGGLFSSISRPAYQAMVPDLLRDDQLTGGYSIFRVSGNLAFAIGPAIGGLLASVSYVLLFFIDAASSIITAIFIARFLQETHPYSVKKSISWQTFSRIFQGYSLLLKDRVLIPLLLLAAIIIPVYWQWTFSVPVFMRDVHNMPTYYYGSMMSMAGIIVVVGQIPLTRSLRSIPPVKLLALGSILFALGFGMFGFVASFGLFLLASAIITIGEMVFFPSQQAIVAKLAPEEMRGRYMAASGIAFSLPNIFGPALGGLLMEYSDPNLIWYLAGFVCIFGAVAYLVFHNQINSNSPLTSL